MMAHATSLLSPPVCSDTRGLNGSPQHAHTCNLCEWSDLGSGLLGTFYIIWSGAAALRVCKPRALVHTGANILFDLRKLASRV